MTEKKDKKPGKKERLDELEGKLREAKANRSAVKPHFDAKRKEIETSRKGPVGILRTTFRESGKMQHTQHGRITGCSLEQLKLLQLAFRERVVPVEDPQAFRILDSR